jgi:alpha-beta hydrolase superfamily lysophospholipase
VHGSEDRWIRPELGRRLYERATVPAKRFVLVEGGSHYSAASVGRAQVREALRALFGIGGT